jgi:pilus assembly protein CpaE
MDESFLRRLLIEHSSGLSVLPGPAPMNRNKLRREQVQAGLEILRSYFDQVVVDLPHDLENGTAAALEASDLVFFIISPNVSALRLATAAIGGLRHTGFNSKKLRLVLMRNSAGEDITSKQAREMLGFDIYWTLPNDDSAVLNAINNGAPLVTATPRSKIAKSLKELSASVADERLSDVAERPFTLLGWNLGRIS